MEEMLKKLKEELLNKKITLLDLDNTVQSIVENTNSLFDAEKDCMEQNSCAYFVREDKFLGRKDIIVGWEVIEEKENNLETIVEVDDIWEN